jgi:hypothetical protein
MPDGGGRVKGSRHAPFVRLANFRAFGYSLSITDGTEHILFIGFPAFST